MSILFPWYLIREDAIETRDFKHFRKTELVEIVQKYREQLGRFEMQQQECIELLEILYNREKNFYLIDLKRKIYNGKKITTGNLLLQSDELEKLNQYTQIRDTLSNLRSEYIDLYNKVEKKERKKLQKIIRGNQKILNPLPLLNRNFNYKLNKFLEEPTDKHKSKVKKIDFQLSRILSRATVKTSPFSSFTSVSLRKWEEDQPKKRKIYNTRINFYIMQKIIDVLTQENELKEYVDYRLAPSTEVNQKRVFEVQVDLNRGKIFNNVDKKVSVHSNTLLDMMIEMYKKQECISYSELRNMLTKHLDNEKCDKFLNTLISRNILFPNITVDEFINFPEKDFLNKLRLYAMKNKKATDVLICYQKLEKLLKEYQATTGLKRFEINNHIINKLTALENNLGVTFQKDLVFYEDYIDDTITTQCELKKIVTAEEQDLTLMQKLSLLCNTALEVRLEFAYMFKAKYGERSISATNKEVYDLYMTIINKFTNWTDVLAPVKGIKSPLAKKMEKYKAKIKELFIEAKQNKCMIQIDKEKIENLYKDYKKNIHVNVDPSTILFQIDHEKMILNKIYSGKLRLFLRFFYYYNDIYKDPDFLDYINRVFSDKSLEIREGFGFNANHHQIFLKKRLIVGNSRGVDAQSEQMIFLNNLYFKFDSTEGLVHLYEENEEKIESIEVIGSLVDYMLPYSIQILNFNNSPRFDIDYINIWNEDKAKLISDYLPRIVVGALTISRKKWILNMEYLRSKKPINEQAFELVNLFLNENLPTEFFIKKYIGSEDEAIDYATIKKTALKPQYVNLRSPLYIKDFIKIIDQNNFVMLEEVYPDIDHYKKNVEYQIEYKGEC